MIVYITKLNDPINPRKVPQNLFLHSPPPCPRNRPSSRTAPSASRTPPSPPSPANAATRSSTPAAVSAVRLSRRRTPHAELPPPPNRPAATSEVVRDRSNNSRPPRPLRQRPHPPSMVTSRDVGRRGCAARSPTITIRRSLTRRKRRRSDG